MTDKEIIQAFLTNNQKGIREVYMAWRTPFWESISYKTQIDEDYREDAYHEAMLRLQEHILSGRLTAENLTGSVLGYLKGIGYYVAKELINGRREMPASRVFASTEENRPDTTDTLSDNDEAEPNNGGQSYRDSSNAYDLTKDMIAEERNRIIREQVMLLGKPCAPLLVGFYWDNLSMNQLADRLGYSNGDSAKAQKAKCMKKVMNHVKQTLIAYGYGY